MDNMGEGSIIQRRMNEAGTILMTPLEINRPQIDGGQDEGLLILEEGEK